MIDIVANYIKKQEQTVLDKTAIKLSSKKAETIDVFIQHLNLEIANFIVEKDDYLICSIPNYKPFFIFYKDTLPYKSFTKYETTRGFCRFRVTVSYGISFYNMKYLIHGTEELSKFLSNLKRSKTIGSHEVPMESDIIGKSS